VVVGTPVTDQIDAPIAPDPADRRRFAVEASGRPARTLVRVIETAGGVSLVELELITGRTHQARVHLAHAGHAILGDPLYGAARGQAPRLLLHAARLELPGLALASPVRWDRLADRANFA
jgi:23S rRNA pseudouridine1911/1915/1917 synthase